MARARSLRHQARTTRADAPAVSPRGKRSRRSTRASTRIGGASRNKSRPGRSAGGGRNQSTPTGAFMEPMKARPSTTLPPAGWHLEVKFDGYRALAVCHGREVQLWSRNHERMDDDFSEVVDALRCINFADAVIDGEVVALDRSGRSAFQLLQRRALERERAPILYYAFDLLHFDGVSRLDVPIEKRREELARALRGAPPAVKLSPSFDVTPAQMLKEIRRQGLEGLIAKRPGSGYEPGRRSGAWIKYRIALDQELIIGGFTPPRGARTHLGALLLGYYANGKLLYAGKVGTGFDQKALKELHGLLTRHVRKTSPFHDLAGADRAESRRLLGAAEREVTWLEPRVVCQVRFSEWTEGGRLRQPVYLGLRRDKKPEEVVREPRIPSAA